MKIGISVADFTWPGGATSIGPTLGRIARRAEEAGVYSLWVMDHFFQIGLNGPPENEMLEGYSALAFMAAQTERAKLGTLVTGVTYRHPGILVKTATTLDVLSGGRSYLGIGAAWNEQEHRGLGVPFPPMTERFERLEETLKIAKQMWAGDFSAIKGQHYQLDWPLNSPNTLQHPHPPIMIGGSGERKTLRLVAQYADACNLFDTDLGTLRHKLNVLRQHCADIGRDYDSIEKTTVSAVTLPADPRESAQALDQTIAHFRDLADLGITHAILGIPNLWRDETLDRLGELVAAAAEIAPVGAKS